MKFGNESQINLIASEVGGAVGGAPPEAQTELFNALIDSCTEAVELGSLDPKVCITSNSFSLSTCILCYLFFLYLLKCLLHVILHPGAFAGFLWCASEGK